MSDRLSIAFQGTKSGLAIAIDETQQFQTLLGDLEHKLDDSGYFFVNAKVTLSLGRRNLDEKELKLVQKTIEGKHGLKISAVKTASDESRAAAEVLGLKVLDSTQESQTHRPPRNGSLNTGRIRKKKRASASPELPTEFLRYTVRSGQIFETRGNLVILGDVNAGAEVVAGGDILVFGALRGLAHAGAAGKSDAIIVALNLKATQLRIAGKIARAQDAATSNKGPEFAFIENGQIVIEAWSSVNRNMLIAEANERIGYV